MNLFITFVLLVCLTGCRSPVQDTPPSPTKSASIMPMQQIPTINRLGMISATETNFVSLAWNPASDQAVTGYKLYYGTNSGVYFESMDVGAVTSAVVSLVSFVDSDTEWFFAATAYDSTGLESPFSNEAHWPAYPPIITGFHLSGAGLVESAADLLHWSAFTNVNPQGVDLPYDAGTRFFRGTNLSLKPILFYQQ